MFTVFSVPKPFEGHIGVIQYNAIRSWIRLTPQPEVILYGAEKGTAAVAERLGVGHDPDIRLTPYGTPIVTDAFARTQRAARYDWLCYINSDVIAMGDLARAIGQVAEWERPVLMSGRRWRVEVVEFLEFDDDWEMAWRRRVLRSGSPDSVGRMDYFVFPRGLFWDLPDFAIGRSRWDSYLPWRARAAGADFVDASEVVLVAHQNHAYAHQDGKAGFRDGPDGLRNLRLADGRTVTLGQADHKLTHRGVRRAMDLVRLRGWLWAQREIPVLAPLARRSLSYESKQRVKRCLLS